MSISQKVGVTTSSIGKITAENLEDQKSSAVSSTSGIISEWTRIAGLASRAEGNDRTITGEISEARAQVEAMTRAKNTFLATLAQLQTDLTAAQTRFSTALDTAERAFDTDLSTAQTEIGRDITSIETSNEGNIGIHNEIQTLAS